MQSICRHKSAVYMLIIIIITANINKIATSNTLPLQRERGVSFGLISCPAVLRSFAQQLLNAHCSLPPRKVSFLRGTNGHIWTPFWSLGDIRDCEATASLCHKHSSLGKGVHKCGGHLLLSCIFIRYVFEKGKKKICVLLSARALSSAFILH